MSLNNILKRFRGETKPQSTLNKDGQPNAKGFHSSRLADRDVDELIGLCKGILADGIVTQPEAETLIAWLNNNPHVASRFPANILFERLQEMMDDGILSADEERDLIVTLLEITGGTLVESPSQGGGLSATLPLCQPAPDVTFDRARFVLTGKFASGARSECQDFIVQLGGIIDKNITKKTNYLVIGAIGSRDWIHSSWGRKIERAVELRENGCDISIISEEHWLKHL